MKIKPRLPSLQRGHPLTQGLIGAWLAYEGTRPGLRDLSPLNSHGNFTSSDVSYIKSEHGPTLRFGDTVGNRITMPGTDTEEHPLGLVSGPYTLFFFLRRRSNSALFQHVLGMRSGSDFQYSLRINSGRLNFLDSSDSVDGPTVPIEDVFHSYAVTAPSSGDITWYKDGVVDSTSTERTMTYKDIKFTVGDLLDSDTQPLSGDIPVILFYNRQLTARLIEDLHIDPYRAFRPVSHYWPSIFVTEEVAEAPADHDPRSGFRRRIIVAS